MLSSAFATFAFDFGVGMKSAHKLILNEGAFGVTDSLKLCWKQVERSKGGEGVKQKQHFWNCQEALKEMSST